MSEIVPLRREAEIPKTEVASVENQARAEAKARLAQHALVAEAEKALQRCDGRGSSVETLQAAIAQAEPVVAGLEPLRQWLATARRPARRDDARALALRE